MTRAVRSALLSALLILAVSAAPAIAAGGHQPKARSAPKTAAASSPASWAWSALVNVFAHLGGMMDPDGVKAATPTTPLTTSTSPPPPPGDLGGTMDPNG